MKRFLALLLAVLTVLTLTACSSDNGSDTPDDKDPETQVSPDDIALKSENFTVTMAEASYIFFQNYKDFRYNNSESFNVYNIDPDKSLKEQEYHDGITWFDYFKDATVSYFEYILTFCEAARADGIELTDDDLKTIDETVASWTKYASDMDYTEDELFELYLGKNVNSAALRTYLEKETLAFKYYDKLVGAYEFTDEEMAAFAEKNYDSFYSVNYIKYTLDEDSDENAAVHAAELAATNDSEQFAAYIQNHLDNVKSYDSDEVTLDSCYVNYAAKNAQSDFSKWAFETAKVGETYTEANDVDGQYTVYMLTSAPSLQEYKTRNIRYILENVSSHSSYQDTMDYVNGLLDKWKEGEATEHSFGEMAYNYSQDKTTNMNGGLLENISKSSREFSKDLINWVFDESRAAGDTAVLKNNQAYIAVYYIGEDEVQWKYLARVGMTEEKYTADYEALQKVYPVTVDDAVVYGIEG